jgi:hypothetical protein
LWNAFRYRDRDPFPRAGGRLQRARRAHRQVLIGRNARHVADANDGAVVAHAQRQRIRKIGEYEQRLQQVIAVGAPARHMKEQIDFCRRSDDEHCPRWSTNRHYDRAAPASCQRSTAMRTSIGSVSG